MKSISGKIFLFTLTLLVTAGCKKNIVNTDKQALLFQLDYINYAWGYQHNGFLIDNEGNILTYSSPEAWHFPDDDLTLSETDVTENISKCTHSGIKIPAEELNKFSNYIKNIASSKVTAIKNTGADAGSTEFICYQFSQSSLKYKGSLIKREGDFTCENLNFYSKKVVAWMREINDSIIKN
jgi:hypothetical protein